MVQQGDAARTPVPVAASHQHAFVVAGVLGPVVRGTAERAASPGGVVVRLLVVGVDSTLRAGV